MSRLRHCRFAVLSRVANSHFDSGASTGLSDTQSSFSCCT